MRVENWVIQTDPARKEVPMMGIEVAKGLLFDQGSSEWPSGGTIRTPACSSSR